jgi:adenylate cyclase
MGKKCRMATEIERKFLVSGDGWRSVTEGSRYIVQAYVALDGPVSLRVRIVDDARALLTVKIGVSQLSRDEFEYPIPMSDARTMIAAAGGRIVEKTRHAIGLGGFVWEVDVYAGALAGLVIAEVEMRSEDDDPVLPDWLGREVTGESDWSNAVLAVRGLPAGAAPRREGEPV